MELQLRPDKETDSPEKHGDFARKKDKTQKEREEVCKAPPLPPDHDKAVCDQEKRQDEDQQGKKNEQEQQNLVSHSIEKGEDERYH